MDSDLSGSLVQKNSTFHRNCPWNYGDVSLQSPRGIEQAACSTQLLIVQTPKAVGLQLIYREASRRGGWCVYGRAGGEWLESGLAGSQGPAAWLES